MCLRLEQTQKYLQKKTVRQNPEFLKTCKRVRKRKNTANALIVSSVLLCFKKYSRYAILAFLRFSSVLGKMRLKERE